MATAVELTDVERHLRPLQARCRDNAARRRTRMRDGGVVGAEVDSSDDAVHSFPTNKAADNWNWERLQLMGNPIARINAHHTIQGFSATPADRFGSLQARVYLAWGARVFITYNVWTEAGLVNGAAGEVEHMQWKAGSAPPQLPEVVWVRLLTFRGPQYFKGDLATVIGGETVSLENVIPIAPIDAHDEQPTAARRNRGGPAPGNGAQGGGNSTEGRCVRTQLPLMLAFGITTHKGQGCSLDRVFRQVNQLTRIPRGTGDSESHAKPTAPVSIAGVREAAARISPHVHMTPVLKCRALDDMSGGREVFFKCELFQKTGSFKARGACNAVLQAPPECRDIVTHSSGNHAQALAWAANVKGVNAHIIMPNNSMAVKVAAVRGYGASITLCENTKTGRESTAATVLSGLPHAILVHPYNDTRVQCGQGTVGLELVEQVRSLTGGQDLDAVIVPVGGGGLISGVATAVKALCPEIRVIGAEPEKAADAFRSKRSGTLCGHDCEGMPDTIADGLRTTLGSKTWPVVRDAVDEIVTVSEADIRLWMRVVYERMKLAIEPSAAVGVAALMSPRVRGMSSEMKRVGVVLCGGNVDVTMLQDLLAGVGVPPN